MNALHGLSSNIRESCDGDISKCNISATIFHKSIGNFSYIVFVCICAGLDITLLYWIIIVDYYRAYMDYTGYIGYAIYNRTLVVLYGLFG